MIKDDEQYVQTLGLCRGAREAMDREKDKWRKKRAKEDYENFLRQIVAYTKR